MLRREIVRDGGRATQRWILYAGRAFKGQRRNVPEEGFSCDHSTDVLTF